MHPALSPLPAPLCCSPLLRGAELSRYEQSLPGLRRAPVEGLAQALAASPGWPQACRATLLVRSRPQPLLAVVGDFDEAGRAWLQGQIRALHHACEHLRYVGYDQVETSCRALADLLRNHFGSEMLTQARFTAIPRGGLVILGLLAVLLDLRNDQMSPPFSTELPCIVVDDCALTGARFRRFLRTVESAFIVFAPLYSHPELRSAIVRRERRVKACVSARDLPGLPHPPGLPHFEPAPDGEPGAFYWSGQTEALCFPWNEPDRSVWNPVSRQWDLAWRIVPPGLCMKNQPARAPVAIQIQAEGTGPLRPSERALFVESEGQITLFDLGTGQGFLLGGAGSDLWRALLRQGDLDQASGELARDYDASLETVRSDAERFVHELLGRGLLEEDGHAEPPAG